MEYKYMDVLPAYIDGEMKKESPNIQIYGMNMYFINKPYMRYTNDIILMKKPYRNIFKNTEY